MSPRNSLNFDLQISGEIRRSRENLESRDAEEWIESFEACRRQAMDALALAQAFQKKFYNKGRLDVEFSEGDYVLLNPHSLELRKSFKGKGRKLLMKYDRPFEIIQKISPLAYRLRMPASYGMNPVLNIAHLERYHQDVPETNETAPDRDRRNLSRLDFEDLPEFEVECIVAERMTKRNKRRSQRQYKVRFTGYSPEFDEWLMRNQLKNAPDALTEWEKKH